MVPSRTIVKFIQNYSKVISAMTNFIKPTKVLCVFFEFCNIFIVIIQSTLPCTIIFIEFSF